MNFEPKDFPIGKLFGLLTGSVSPRPIALVSSVDKAGNVNLSPFSFFNVFGANPPIFVFSPSRRVRDNTTKHTLDNVLEVPEVVIHIVNHAMVEQMSLSSTEYAKGVNEFIKAGFTQIDADLVQPPRVAESPIAFECKVKQVIATGQDGGAGNLVICEGIKIHIDDAVLDSDGAIDPVKLDVVARLGKNNYAHINSTSIFEVAKPLNKKGIGVDALPSAIKNSKVLSGNDLGKLGNVEQMPSKEEIELFKDNALLHSIHNENDRHEVAKGLLQFNKVKEAWLVLLS